MLIDGKIPVANGSFIARDDEKATIVAFGLNLHLKFSKDGGAPRTEMLPGGIFHLVNSDNALGTWATFDGELSGRKVRGTVVVYFIGDPGQGVRVIHYTII
jgi:hypothetical protein